MTTVAGSLGQLAGTAASTIKVSEFAEFPAKGRATGGCAVIEWAKVRTHSSFAWVGQAPARAETAAGKAITLPR